MVGNADRDCIQKFYLTITSFACSTLGEMDFRFFSCECDVIVTFFIEPYWPYSLVSPSTFILFEEDRKFVSLIVCSSLSHLLPPLPVWVIFFSSDYFSSNFGWGVYYTTFHLFKLRFFSSFILDSLCLLYLDLFKCTLNANKISKILFKILFNHENYLIYVVLFLMKFFTYIRWKHSTHQCSTE